MYLPKLGAFAALAGITNAFLVPPSVSSASSAVVDVLPFEAEAIADSRVLEVNCPGCPIQSTKVASAESILRVNFTIDHTDFDKLRVNDVQIYPHAKAFMPLAITADQLIKAPDGTWSYSSSPELGYSLSVRHIPDTTQEPMKLIAINLEIIEVGNKFIRLPAIEIKLLETDSGKLMIGDSQIQPEKELNYHPECTDTLCKLRAILADKVASLKSGLRKECGGKPKSGHARPHFTGIKGGPRPHGHSQPRPNSHPHHRRPHHSAFGRFIRGVTMHIFIPILIGIAVGITASLVGMVVGHIAIFFWRLLFRRGERAQYCRVKQEETIVDVDDESKGFLENQGPPPVYEVVVDEKTEQK